MPESRWTTQEEIEAMRLVIAREKERVASPASRFGRSLVKWLGRAAFLALVLVLVFTFITIQITKSKGETPSLFGIYLFMVESGSMDPTIPRGTVIMARKPDDPTALGKDDIVTFRTLGGAVATHRIVEVLTLENGGIAYLTKGDNPDSSPDLEILDPDRILAKFVAKIPLS